MKYFDFYHIPTAINKDVADLIIDQFAADKGMEPGTLDQIKKVDPVIRVCNVKWLNTDSWVAGMLAHFIHTANNNLYEFDLQEWGTPIQFTSYSEPGHHYDWHVDSAQSDLNPDFVRKLTISLCLTPKEEYEGGEFCIRIGDREFELKLDVGEAILFPADTWHKVKPLKSGKRTTLVGWMAGPKWR